MTKLIALDNGHGLNTPGKRTPVFTDGTTSPLTGKNFMHEWEFNRAVVQKLKVELERCGFRTLEVSPSEEDTDLMERCRIANRAGADFFLSVHANALDGDFDGNGTDGKDPRGIETLTIGKGEGLRVGKLLQAELVAATGLYDRGMKDGSWLAVIKYTDMPAALVECGFMDNIIEAKLMLTESYREVCAVALAKGLCKAYGVAYVPKEEKSVAKGKTKFSDVPAGHWAEDVIKVASEAGIMKGYPDGTFGLGKPVTREELAAVVAALLKK